MANFVSWPIFADTEDPKGSKSRVDLHIGDTVRIHYKLIEKEKVTGKTKREVHEETRERTQPFEGILIAVRGGAENTMITVRRIGVGAIGIERIFPLISPWIKKIEVKKHGDVRRAKLYYLRGRTGKEATRIHEADVASPTTTG